jgi:hypothetical protein
MIEAVSASEQPRQRTMMDEYGMIRTHMGSSIDQKIVAVHGTLCTNPSRKVNQQPSSSSDTSVNFYETELRNASENNIFILVAVKSHK